ncbi:MAG: hypothetical protein ACOVRK_12740, partial [Chryseobacterium taeanense]
MPTNQCLVNSGAINIAKKALKSGFQYAMKMIFYYINNNNIDITSPATVNIIPLLNALVFGLNIQ